MYMCVSHIQRGQWAVAVHGSTPFPLYTSLLKHYILFFILFLDIGTLGHFLRAEIAGDGVASYHTSVKEENLMSGHV